MQIFRLYIDPGTGSMLFAVLFSLLGAAFYFASGLFVKLKFLISGGKKSDTSDKKIPIVIFSDDKRYWSVFRPICREFDSRGIDVVYYTASPDDPCLENEFRHIKASFIGEGNKAFSKLNFLNARIVISTTPGLDVYQWKRSKNVDYYVHVLHAAGDVVAYRMFGLDYYDAVLTSADFQEEDLRRLEKLRGLPEKEIRKVGIPYMDDMLKRLDESKNESKDDETTVILAPSWGINSIFNRFGDTIIDALIETGYNIIVRPHPQSFTSEKAMIDGLMAKYPETEKLKWNRDNDNFDVLRNSDIMISDFSGVILDYVLVYDKPFIYADADFDVSPYDVWWFNEPLRMVEAYGEVGKKLEMDSLSNMKQLIDSCISSHELSEKRDALRNEAWAYIGEGAVRTVDYFEEKLNELDMLKGDV